jgi:hypothetical protein
MNPVVLHVVRPYSSEEEYLAAEAWTIDARSMLLLGQREVELDSAIVFDVTLANGSKIMRAEGRAIGYQPTSVDHPGGVRVRFRRFGAQTKAFIDRALLARERTLAANFSSRPPAPEAAAATPQLTAASASAPGTVSEVLEPFARSGIHRRPGTPVDAPPNREALLARLRERRATLSSVLEGEPDARAADHG